MKRFSAIILLSLIMYYGFSQTEVDALRYSQVSYGGTARFIGSGNAFGAVGADFSTLSQNPAGIALFRKSEISFTPQFFTTKTDADYFGKFRDDSKLNFNISSAGFIGVQHITNPNSIVKSIQLGFGYNKLANYHNMSYTQGYNTYTSMLSPYTLGLNKGDGWDEYTNGLMFDAGLIYYDDTITNHLTNDFDFYYPTPYSKSYGVDQRRSVETWGAQNEMVLSGGMNLDDKLFVGMTLGIPFVRYEEQTYYTEEDINNVVPEFQSFQMNSYLLTKGTGVNFKIGAIFQPVDFLRIGAALHTPTSYMNMTDEYNSRIEADYDFFPSENKNSPQGFFEYRLTTPLRMQGNVAVLVKKMGFVSFDYEWIDYSKSRFRADNRADGSFENTNDNIREQYQSSHNFRVGTEWSYAQMCFRGGINYSTTPYKKNFVIKNDESAFGYSLGLGYRNSNFFIDFAFAHAAKQVDNWLYPASYATPSPTDELVDMKFKNNSYTLTLGVKY